MPTLLLLAACGPGMHEKPALEYMPDMANSDAVKAQEEPMRVPPAGTRPLGFEPYPFAADQGEMAASLTNPLPLDRKTLATGKKMYDTYCIVCHGRRGKGNGFIVPKFPMPPSLHSEKVTTWPDGRIFHAITRGQNLMPSYASQINPEERWAIISYVRALQRASNPTPEDVEAYQNAGGNP
ncbi:MAG: cytochrome c [Deltaproteobacteria bacterium]|nr:cytochrome c [Deltaproteobacteria bacterium]